MANNWKVVGIVNTAELKNLSTDTPWEEVIIENLPLSVMRTPNGHLFTQGSAGSLSTTSIYGFTYNSYFYVWRADGTCIDRDAYLTSPINAGSVVVCLVPKSLTEYHHVKPEDQVVSSLPSVWQKKVVDAFGSSQSDP